MIERTPVPVTVIAGFLGSGKTTLLNTLLARTEGRRLAVLVNDFGELNIDRSLIAEVTDDVQALTNGCICCSMQGELLEQIGRLATRQPAPDHILIECSGVSEPARIIRTLGYPELQRVARLDSVTTVVDPTTLSGLDGQYADLARAQIGAADLRILNKTDLVGRDELDNVRERWLADSRPVFETTNSFIPIDLLLDSGRSLDANTSPLTSSEAHHGFDTWQIELPGVFQLKTLRKMLNQLPAGVFRMKGCVALAERPGELFWLHWVGGRINLRQVIDSDGLQANHIVVITRRSKGLRQLLLERFSSCLAWPDRDV